MAQYRSGHLDEEEQDSLTELSPLYPGDIVTDVDGNSFRMVVTAIPEKSVSDVEMGGDDTPETVAKANPRYPANDRAVEVAYVDSDDTELDTDDTYTFPRGRLELVASTRDRSDWGDDE